MKIAILGATGHIAKNLITRLSPAYELFLVARNKEALLEFVDREAVNKERMLCMDFTQFSSYAYDVVINCIGIGDPAKLKRVNGEIFRLTEVFDHMVMDYLAVHPSTLYINFSSGIAYGSNFQTPADQNKQAVININSISPTDYYTISKINTEARHRSYSRLNIVDLRVFGFFSRYIDLNTPYFLCDIINSMNKREVFITGSHDMVRDYVHPEDLVQMIERCIYIRQLNDVFDVYSQEPVSKRQILAFFEQRFGLRASVENDGIFQPVTGIKSNYYSLNRKSDMIGYAPRYSSIEAIVAELSYVLR